MKKIFTFFAITFGLVSVLSAQKTLDPDQFVNTQITGPGVYKVEAGKAYAFDGRIDLTYEITIEGPEVSWIMNATNPPVLLNTPGADGSSRSFFEIKAGGGLTMKNLIISGSNSNTEVVGNFIYNGGGNKIVMDNVCFTDWKDFAIQNGYKGLEISVTNCVYINGVRLSYSPWGGFPLRMDVAANNVLWQNNTVVNSGRLITNSGPFFNANIHEIHNTYLNMSVNGHEQRANEFITANNIFYNYHFIGRHTENHSSPNNIYDSYFTTWNYFSEAKDSLNKISLYLGKNLFYRPQEIVNWFTTTGGDSIATSLLWEHADVDSFIVTDNNYTIGANYADMDPGFKTGPGNLSKIVSWINNYHLNQSADFVDWRIASTVTFNNDGLPVLHWPPAFDLSYTNAGLQKAGTDGLPLGDLNWFPEKKAQYLANKSAIITALRDSMVNAKYVYDPATMDNTPLIKDLATSAKQIGSGQFNLTNYPNPVDHNTTIQFSLPKQSMVSLSVFNVYGQKVFETEKEFVSGTHKLNFDASKLSSGIYMYTLKAATIDGLNLVESKKMIKK